MPTRGRPERPRSSNPETNVVYDRGSKRLVEFGVGVNVTGTKYLAQTIGIGVAEQQGVEVEIGIGVAEQKEEDFGLGIGAMDWSGNTKTRDPFGVGITVGESAGYAAPPRLVLPNALSLGQEVRRRGEPIAVVD
jgi:hypothetical protein